MTKDKSDFNRKTIGVELETRRGGVNMRTPKATDATNHFEKNLEVTRYAENTKLTVKEERKARAELATAARKLSRREPI